MRDGGEIDGEKLLDYLKDATGATFLRSLRRPLPREMPDLEWSKTHFLQSLPTKGRYLDLGCGNNSPWYTKQFLPEWHYIGLDVEDYNQQNKTIADEYIVTTGSEFCDAIGRYADTIDAVMSSHNLEHCDNRDLTVRYMAQALKTGGRLFMSFPCADSVNFPGRGGCLNYHDDYTHQGSPPDFGRTISILTEEGVKILYATTRYQPPIGWLMGLQDEPESSGSREVKLGTWWYWGFETLIWGEKL
ncbi:Methyltransferase type 11 [Asticcacaulis excentricus CB 48]|uniref:Methyltransferase type 11 n=2 Tax=Asticcacaulis excentricus TaxID=78587 RepID=E8RMP2_ASTEC|nr:Methyltransferase type 11 [Asticcacaulis excentricus CB 48]